MSFLHKLPETLSSNRFIVWLFFAFFCLLYVSGDYVFYRVNYLKLTILALYSCIFCILLVFQICNKGILRRDFFIIAILFLPLGVTIPGLVSTGGTHSYGFFLEFVSQSLCILLACFSYFLFSSARQIKVIFNLFSIIVIYITLVSLLQKLGFEPLKNLFINPFEAYWSFEQTAYTGIRSRVDATFGNPNYLASWVSILLPLYLSLIYRINVNTLNFKYSKADSLKFLAIIGLVLILVFTQTRSAFAASLFSCSALIIFTQSFIRLKSVSLNPYIFLFLLLLLSFFSFNYDRLIELIKLSAWEGRLIPWRASFNSIIDSPVFGYGIGSSYSLFFEYVNSDVDLYNSSVSYSHVHNEWLEVLQEGGIFGFTGYLIFWGFVFFKGIMFIRQDGNIGLKRTMLGLLCGIFAYHIHSLFSVAPRMISVRALAYFFVAMVFVLAYKTEVKTNSDHQLTKKSQSALVVFFVFFTLSCFIWVMKFSISQFHIAKGLSLINTSPIYILDASENSKDAYLLHEASILLSDAKQGTKLKYISNKLASIFPNYRNVDYLSAYAEFLTGDMNYAKEIALNYQNRRIYEPSVNILLSAISVIENDEDMFKRQIELIIKSNFCKLIYKEPCENINIKVIYGYFPYFLDIIKKQSSVNVYLSFESLLFLKKLSMNDDLKIEAVARAINQSLSGSRYFTPKNLTTDGKLAEQIRQYIDLRRQIDSVEEEKRVKVLEFNDLSLWSQVDAYFELDHMLTEKSVKLALQSSELENQLSDQIDIDKFMQRRELYQHLVSWLTQIVMMSRDAGGSQ